MPFDAVFVTPLFLIVHLFSHFIFKFLFLFFLKIP